MHDTTQWTTAVSTGSVVLAAAGLLSGSAAATHWLARDLLVGFDVTPVPERVVRAGRVITAIGPAAAIDISLWMAARSGGPGLAREIQGELAAGLDRSFDPATSWKAAAMVAGWQSGQGGPAATTRAQELWHRLGDLLSAGNRAGNAGSRAASGDDVPVLGDDVWELPDYTPDY
jgi:hypothetical protein